MTNNKITKIGILCDSKPPIFPILNLDITDLLITGTFSLNELDLSNLPNLINLEITHLSFEKIKLHKSIYSLHYLEKIKITNMSLATILIDIIFFKSKTLHVFECNDDILFY